MVCCSKTLVNTFWDLSIILDSSLNMKAHIISVMQPCLKLLLSPMPYMTNQEKPEWMLLASSSTSSRYIHDWLLQLLALPVTLHPLTNIRHAPDQTVKNILHCDHITPIMQKLHWLPIPAWVTFKLGTPMYNIFSHQAPIDMSSLIRPPSNQTRSQGLRSTSHGDMVIPRTNRNCGKRSFAVAGPTIWNSLVLQLKKLLYMYLVFLLNLHCTWISFIGTSQIQRPLRTRLELQRADQIHPATVLNMACLIMLESGKFLQQDINRAQLYSRTQNNLRIFIYLTKNPKTTYNRSPHFFDPTGTL